MRCRALALLVPVLVGFSACPGGAAAQTTTATLQGVARDTSEAVLPGVAIAVRSADTGVTRTAVTDATGRFYVASIPIGRYDVTAELTGFRRQTRPDVRLEVGQEATLNFMLALAGVDEVVTVTAAPPVVETTKTTIDQVVRREQIDMLPISGRTVANLALLAPGVVPQSANGEPVTGGAQPRGSIEILIDGVSNKGTGLGNVRSYVPPDAVEEFQVLTGQYSAEYGNASGIVLQTITRSGTNRLQGSGYYFHRDEALDARNAFATTKSAFAQKQGGAWAGGPIVVDRTHFFASAEITRGVAVATVNAWGESGDVEQPFRYEKALAKITHQFSPRNRLTARILVDQSLRKNEGVGGLDTASRAYDLEKKDYAYVGALSSDFSSHARNELRVQYSDSFLEGRVDNPNAYNVLRPGSRAGKASGLPRGGPERRVQVVDNFSYDAGPHHLKVGSDISRIAVSGYWWPIFPGSFNFATDQPFDSNDLTTYPTTFTRSEGGVKYSDIRATNVSAFAQDSWTVGRALTLNLGVRCDAYSMTDLDLQKPSFAPRLGVAWAPLRNGKMVVRGGFGAFYNSILMNIEDIREQRLQIINPGYPDPFGSGRPPQVVSIGTTRAQEDMAVPRTYSATIGVHRQIGSELDVSADYVNMKGRHLIRLVETNPTVPPRWDREDPTSGYRREEQSNGYSNYQALWLEVRKRWGARARIGGSYTLASGKATHDLESQLAQQDDRYPDDAYGYTSNDERHRVAVSGSVFLPWGVRVSAAMYAWSGRPVNIIVGRDINKNGSTLDRPNLAPGVELGSDAMKQKTSFDIPTTTLGDLPRNAGRGPAFWQIDVRVSKVILVGKARVEVLAEAFNADNHVNLGDWVGNLRSDLFGTSVSAEIPRQVQLGLRVGF